MATETEEKKELNFEKPSKATLTKIAFYGVLILALFLLVRFAMKKDKAATAA